MIKCMKCGIENADTSAYCKACGNLLADKMPAAGMIAAGQGNTVQSDSSGLAPNVAGMLCYLATWVTGIVFLIIEKVDRSVRFHAWQSILTFGFFTVGYALLYEGMTWLLYLLPFAARGLMAITLNVVWGIVVILGFILWIVLMVKTYQGQTYMVPVTGKIAHNLAYKGQSPQETQRNTTTAAYETASTVAKQKPSQEPEATNQETVSHPFKQESTVSMSGNSAAKEEESKFCIICGERIPVRAVYCAKCGQKQG